MKTIITSDVVVAFTQCKLKAFLLLSGTKGTPHEYISILDNETEKSREVHIGKIQDKNPQVPTYSHGAIKRGEKVLVRAVLEYADLKAYADVLTRYQDTSSERRIIYIPTLVVATHRISKEEKLRLAFIGHVLSKLEKTIPQFGIIVGSGNRVYRIKLATLYKKVETILSNLKGWISVSVKEPPPIILSRHCQYCHYNIECENRAKEQDHLSLLDGISTPTLIRKYQRKGIFTVNQLSYLYRPRRKKRRARNPPSVRHSLELQALVIRTGMIYLHQSPNLLRHETELFLDIEGIPDTKSFYLIGILICQGDHSSYFPFWSDKTEDEAQIWAEAIKTLNKYPDCPIYHYGNYEANAIATLGKRYGTDSKRIAENLVNLNPHIYGRIYFPARSNSLKEIGQFIGASWTSPNASGLQTLVWRYYWETTHDPEYKQKLVIYNHEDCQALKHLADFLSTAKEREDLLLDVDRFFHSKKSIGTNVENPLHRELESVLQLAYADYDKRKIRFREEKKHRADIQTVTTGETRGKYKKKRRRVTRLIQVKEITHCPNCGGIDLVKSKKKIEKIQADLVFRRSGVHKSVVKYWGFNTHCRNCKRLIRLGGKARPGRPKEYGSGFKIWIAYQRIALRLSYNSIRIMSQDLFNEDLKDKTIIMLLMEIARDYSPSEGEGICKLLKSPYIHVDETQINIEGLNQYVWVFTDGVRVIFKHTETKEASFVRNFLREYTGVLISDFYAGYDILSCKHQKCWVHVIHDLNNDLYTAPFDDEFGRFVIDVKDLIVPIMEAIQRYGLKNRHLNKFKKKVDRFYDNVISNSYESDICSKYQERFIRYRKSLFTFLDHDSIPWHNNPAESALRHVILQMDISRTFHKSVIESYLTLLGMKQSCKLQNKSFLKFLLSNKAEVDES